MEKYLQYYDKLSFQRLLYHDVWLILCIEAASYCISHGEKHIGYSKLRSICSERLRGITKGERNLSSGSFHPALRKAISKGLLKEVEKAGRTWIVPNIAEIEKIIEVRLKEDEASSIKVRPHNRYQYRGTNLPPIVETVSVSDGLRGVVTKAKTKEVTII